MEKVSRTELAARLRACALLEGDFTLRSGKKSRYYFDKYLFEGTPEVREIVKPLIAKMKKLMLTEKEPYVRFVLDGKDA